ncbi:MAG: DNA-directed DNA polymerase I [Candidatus Bathyarchaeota archaeon]|nr:DNA-directed DNA polymerase I [Candidatus Bathyarchaeota archaeon]MDH5635680.1 DNA-directed DNA polymerase I [Candidatus Bathyarchaeota archaeon]
MKRSLDDFFKVAEREEKKPKESLSAEKPFQERKSLVFKPETPQELRPSYFVSATYNGKKGCASIKLYEPESEKIYFWYDTTGHKPYCFTNLPASELERISRLMSHPGFDHFESLEKYDPLLDQQVTITKVVAKDPLAVGGRPSGCIRDIIPEEYSKLTGLDQPAKVWEAAIKYYQSYIYDNDLAPGMIYKIEKGKLVPVWHEASEDTVRKILELFRGEPEEFMQRVEMWARLLEYPAPRFRRVALDIEVASPIPTRVPDPREAAYQVICATLLGSDGKKKILVLKREGVKEGVENLPSDVTVEYCDSEEKLILKIFEALWDYSFVLTFNGDDFDLRYLYHRALNHLGLNRSQIPIELGRRVCLLKYGIHIDLYKFFFNRSIQIYAFSQKYRGITLNEVGKALVGLEKIELDGPLSELTYTELARYNFRDAEITLALTTFDDDLVMKLILAITRIARMPMEDMSRQGVSRWIRNFLHHEHRRGNMLIPNADDILALKGLTATKAIIKGKKYKGAIVVEPVPGVHFNVAVMDFASLYPSIIKVYNLGYQSILCPHDECKENKVPETPNWICTKKRALESLLIGALRDLRVKWYKPKSKDKTLPNDLRSWYNVIQSALKVILNASYGVFGAETFDLYCPPVAEATAAIGRHVITQTINKARELGIDVIYGDTDSIFLRGPSQDQIKTLEGWSEKELGMELDVDKFYRYSVFSSRKKNYLGIFPDGSVDVKGMTGKKRHIPVFIKKAFDQMEERLGEVKSPAEFEEAKKEIRKIIRDRYLRLKQRRWGDRPEELAFHVVLGKIPEAYTKTVPQHVRAALVLKDMGHDLKAGDLISFVKVAKEPRVKPVQLASNSEIDVDKYVGYLHSTFDQVLDALGLDFDEIIGLTKLERFM